MQSLSELELCVEEVLELEPLPVDEASVSGHEDGGVVNLGDGGVHPDLAEVALQLDDDAGLQGFIKIMTIGNKQIKIKGISMQLSSSLLERLSYLIKMRCLVGEWEG